MQVHQIIENEIYNKMKKKLFLLALIIIALAGSYSFYMYNKPVSSLEKMKTDHFISASELLEQYEDSEEKANEVFLDKVIEVKGIINKIEENEGQYSIYLETENMMSAIICEMDKKITSINLIVGEKVTLKGLCTGYLMDVVLVRSLII